MAKRFGSASNFFRACLNKIFGRSIVPQRSSYFRPELEGLEVRINPSSFSEAGNTLTITLDNPNEQVTLTAGAGNTIKITDTNTAGGAVAGGRVTGLGSTTPTITAAGTAFYTTGIKIIDGGAVIGARVVFADSGVNSYNNDPITVTLTNAQSADVAFNGTNSFGGNVTVTDVGGVVAAESVGSSLTANNLTIIAGGVGNKANGIELLGTLTLNNLTMNGSNVTANNPNNTFAGNVNFTATNMINLQSGGPLTLGNDNLTFQTNVNVPTISSISANGAITQAAGTSLIVWDGQDDSVNYPGFYSSYGYGNTLNFTATGGQINLFNFGNSIDDTIIGLKTTGNKQAIVYSNMNFRSFVLGNVSVGAGTNLWIDAQTSIEQNQYGSTITAGGGTTSMFTIDQVGNTGDILLDNSSQYVASSAGNDFAGPVSFTQTNAAKIINVRFRNIDPAAALPTFTPAAILNPVAAAQLGNFELRFDNAPIAVPAMNISGTVTIIAGGNITQSGPIQAGAGSFTVFGDYGINLPDPANAITGNVSFYTARLGNAFGNLATADSAQNVAFNDSVPVSLGASYLGRGTFTITSTGDILTGGGGKIVQVQGAGKATFNSGGSNVHLDGNNDFTAPVVINGASVNSIILKNVDANADISSPSLPAGFSGDLTITYPNAAFVLSSVLGTALNPLTSLTLTALGILEGTAPAGSIVDAGLTTLNAGAYPILLNGNNQFNPTGSGTVTINNNGRNYITIKDVSPNNRPFTFAGSQFLGSGPLSITASGGITNAGAPIFQAVNADPATFTVTGAGNDVILTGLNDFTGPINASVNGGTINLNNTANLVLGNITTTGAGSTLTATSTGAILQGPGSHLSLAGVSTFTATNGITLGNTSNLFSGAVTLASTFGNAVITSSGGVILGTPALSALATLTVTAQSNISQAVASSISNITETSFTSITGNITLTNAGNNFQTLDLQSANGNDSIITSAALILNQVYLGSSSLAIQVSGNLTQTANGAIIQTGAGAINLTQNGSGNAVLFNLGANGSVVSPNFLTGPITLGPVNQPGWKNVSLASQNGLNLVGLSSGVNLVKLTAGGNINLPVNALTVNSLIVSGKNTNIGSNVNLTNASSFNGGVTFTAPLTISGAATITFNGTVTVNTNSVLNINLTGGNVNFKNNVTANSGINFTLAANSIVHLFGGIWSQGASPINFTDNNGKVTLLIDAGATFATTGSTITMFTGDTVDIYGTFQLSGNNSTATINNGTGLLLFEAGSTYSDHLGATNDLLLKKGNGDTYLGNTPLGPPGSPTLLTIGALGAVSTPIISTPDGGAILGAFNNSLGASGNPIPFFSGSDIVTATYDVTQTLVTPATTGNDIENGTLVKTSITISNLASTANLSVGEQVFGTGIPVGDTIATVLANSVTLVTAATASGTVPLTFAKGNSGLTQVFNGTFVGTTPSGDKITIASSLGASASLVVLQSVPGQPAYLPLGFAVVVRNQTATGANSLTITTTLTTGSGYSLFNGIAIDTPGPASITGINSDFVGTLQTGGTLSGLTLHNVGNTSSAPTFILDNTIGGSTAISVAEVKNTQINLLGPLSNFTSNLVDNTTAFRATSFGSITSRAATVFVVGTGTQLDPGDFGANLLATQTNAGATVIGAVNIAGNLTGTWDVTGNVGPVTAGSTGVGSFWNLGTLGNSNAVNNGGLNAITSLSLGQDDNTTIAANGNLGSLTAVSLNNFAATLVSVGAVRTTGSAALRDFGDITNLVLTVTGAGNALGSITAAGNMTNAAITSIKGNLGAISAGLELSFLTVNDLISANSGSVTSITGGGIDNLTVTAKSLGSLRAAGSVAGGLFGDVTNAFVTLSGTTGTALGGVSINGSLTNSTFNVNNGSMGNFSVLYQVSNDAITLNDGAFGNAGAISAGDWQNTNLRARTVSSLAVNGAAQTSHSPLLLGDLDNSNITVFAPLSSATLGSLRVAGNFLSDFLFAPGGIGSFSVGKSIDFSDIDADLNTSSTAGHIGTFSAGNLRNSVLTANSLGNVSVTGFTTPQANNPNTSVPGNVSNSAITVEGSGVTTSVGSVNVAGNFDNFSTLSLQGSMSGLTVAGSLGDATGPATIMVTNEFQISQGSLGTLSAGDINGATITANSLGSLKTTGSTAFHLLGNIAGSTISTRNKTVGVTSLSATGNLLNDTFNIPASVSTITITGVVDTTRMMVSYATTATKITSLTVGQWNNSDLNTGSIGAFKVAGNSAIAGFSGSVTNGYFDIFGASAGVGLGTFSAVGGINNSTFNVTGGNLTSFSATQFVGSNLYVGFIPPSPGDISAAPGAANWLGTFTLGKFTTTGTFNPTDIINSASFAYSNIVAGSLGTITLTGVNPTRNTKLSNDFQFGVGFRSAGGSQGVLKINGNTTASVPSGAPLLAPNFFYISLAG